MGPTNRTCPENTPSCHVQVIPLTTLHVGPSRSLTYKGRQQERHGCDHEALNVLTVCQHTHNVAVRQPAASGSTKGNAKQRPEPFHTTVPCDARSAHASAAGKNSTTEEENFVKQPVLAPSVSMCQVRLPEHNGDERLHQRHNHNACRHSQPCCVSIPCSQLVAHTCVDTTGHRTVGYLALRDACLHSMGTPSLCICCISKARPTLVFTSTHIVPRKPAGLAEAACQTVEWMRMLAQHC